MMPRHPLYVVSKDRWQHERRLTIRTLEDMRVPYFVVVEAQEADAYGSAIDPTLGTILALDPSYQRDYNTCDDWGDAKGRGPGPARNFAWDHAMANGHAWHWVMDDNINGFCRFNHDKKHRVADGTIFRCMEDFCRRYANVAMAGPNYRFFVNNRSQAKIPFAINTRIYSCNLIRNDVPFRWRGRYNEDTILSLDLLKQGWCTILFSAFLQNKIVTQAIRGGNTDEFYIHEGTLEKSKMLVRLHPDVARLAWKYGRWHHHVDYRPFKHNRLKLRPDVEISAGINEYGMQLVSVVA